MCSCFGSAKSVLPMGLRHSIVGASRNQRGFTGSRENSMSVRPGSPLKASLNISVALQLCSSCSSLDSRWRKFSKNFAR